MPFGRTALSLLLIVIINKSTINQNKRNMNVYTEMNILAYKIKDKFLREMCIKFGIPDTLHKLVCHYMNGLVFWGTKRIDRGYLHSLCENDKEIFKRVAKWLYIGELSYDYLSVAMNF